MTTVRYPNSTTNDNAGRLIQAIQDPAVRQITLFATASHPDAGHSAETDGFETILPLLAALSVTTTGDVTVYDGRFLTAALVHRYSEVRDVLDAAVETKKVFYAATPAPFTSGLDPADAAQRLRDVLPVISLDRTTRSRYFKMLSSFVTEAEFATLVGGSD